MKKSDLSPGTKFFVTEESVPIALTPDGNASFYSGRQALKSDHKFLLSAFETPGEGVHPVSFEQFAKAVGKLVAIEKQSAPLSVFSCTKPEDFPAGTKFFVEGYDVPVTVLPDGKAYSWHGGYAYTFNEGYKGFAPFMSNHELRTVSFSEFVKAVESVPLAKNPPLNITAAEMQATIALMRAEELSDYKAGFKVDCRNVPTNFPG